VAGAAIPQIEIPPRVDLRAPRSELKAKDSHSNKAGEIENLSYHCDSFPAGL